MSGPVSGAGGPAEAPAETLARMARAACNALPDSQFPSHAAAALGHRFGYAECAGPDCSCWAGRRRLQAAAWAAMRESEQTAAPAPLAAKGAGAPMKPAPVARLVSPEAG